MRIPIDFPPIITSKDLNILRHKVVEDFSYFSDKNIIYMDYPVHNNIGDHLIYWGAMNALSSNGNNIVGQFNDENYEKEKVQRLIESHNAIIICHGGGNFGDLYPKHQHFRLQLISDFPNIQIVIMPQSVFYNSRCGMKEQLGLFVADNIHVHVRDNNSFELLKLHHINVIKTPDCAHFIKEQFIKTKKNKKDSSVLIFRRRDSESISGESIEFDWEDLIQTSDRLFYKILRVVCKVKFTPNIAIKLFKLYSIRLIGKAVNHYEPYNSIDTDRLHGFILAVIMNKQVHHSDNSYRKIERYKSTWIPKTKK